jgi:hypothetical protein
MANCDAHGRASWSLITVLFGVFELLGLLAGHWGPGDPFCESLGEYFSLISPPPIMVWIWMFSSGSCVGNLGPQLVVLFGETVETVGESRPLGTRLWGLYLPPTPCPTLFPVCHDATALSSTCSCCHGVLSCQGPETHSQVTMDWISEIMNQNKSFLY